MTAASRLMRLRPATKVLVLEKSRYISYSICGAPYYVEGLVARAEDLLALTPEKAKADRGISVRNEWEATDILTGRREVRARDLRSGLEENLPYDKLLIATGYRPALQNIQGADHPSVFKISRLEDAIAIRRFIDSRRPRTAIVVGGGYIGLNMAEALIKKGISVQVLERNEQVFPDADPDIAQLIARECTAQGIRIAYFEAAREIKLQEDVSCCVVTSSARYQADMIVVDTGVVPEVELAQKAGLRIGGSGAIEVDCRMETSQNGIYAAGNCAEAKHLITGRPVASGLGTHAVQQGRVAAENIAGIRSEYPGMLKTSITKFFDLSLACTGLSEAEGRRLGFDCDSARVTTPARAAYFPPEEKVTVKIVFDRRSQKILGAQIAGSPWTCKRIDVAVTAITSGLTLEQLAQLDLAYSPPHSPLWDPLQVAAHAALRKLG